MKKPDLKTVVAVAEIISALAIVVSLIYAVNEFRRAQTLTSRDVENIAYARMMERDRLLIENPDFAIIYVNAVAGFDRLAEQDRVRYLAFEHIYFDSWETLWYYYQQGVMDEGAWDSWNNWFISDSKNKPAIAWEENRKHFSGQFLEMVDGVLLSN